MLQAQQSASRTSSREDLARILTGVHYPVTAEDLMVLALRRRTPSEVLWQLNQLPYDRRFNSAADVAGYLDAVASPTLGRN
jgi:hypothetical protein